MGDVFIAHVEEDADVALEIAFGLSKAGYSTWCYEVDSIPGPSYLIQTGKAVTASQAVVVVISPHSVGSRQVTKEIVRAHESGKDFIPILRGITHVEFQNRQPEWREAVGAAASIDVPPEGVADILPRIISGLKALGIHPGSKADSARIGQIRKALNKLQVRGTLEKAEELPAPTRKPEAEAIAAEVPPAKIAKETFRRKRWVKPALITSGVVVVAVIAIILAGSLLSKPAPSPPPVAAPPAPSVAAPPATPAGVEGSVLAFFDDFEDGNADNWKLDLGWSVLPDNGNYVLAGQQHSFARPNVAGWTDYTAQTRIKLVNGSLHFSVRENTGGGHIRYFIGVSLDKIWLSKQIKDDFFDLDQRGQAIGLDKWYTVKAVLQGNNVKVYLDDKVLIDYTDHENPILSGSFSFETSLGESLAYFDDVSVRVSQAEYSPTPVSTASVTFPDRNLDEAVRSALKKKAGEEITAADLADLGRVDASKRGITDLTGIQYCINLDGIELQENQIKDISALSSLSKLTLLALHENQISDISALSSLTNLIELYIDENQISDITVLSSMTMLRELHMSGNQISDVSALSSLTSLIELWIIANQITDISPLSTLTNLTDLQLKYNRISDISTLASLTNLSFLDLDFNRISDIQPLVANSGLSAGDRVSLRGNPLSSESLNVYIPQLEQRGVIVTIK